MEIATEERLVGQRHDENLSEREVSQCSTPAREDETYEATTSAVFFPGLLFGWLRAWRGDIGAGIVFHALSNLYADVLVRGWL